MAEKFRKIVNAPHRAFGRATEKIRQMNPTSKTGKVGRVAGMTTTALFQFLLWATKYITLDNHALRKLEETLRDMQVGKNKKGQDKKLSSLMKQYPNLSAHLIYYMMFASIIGGTVVADKVSDRIEENRIERQIAESKRGTYAAYFDRLRGVTPYLIADLIAMEGVRVNEDGLHTPYLCSKGVWTIGFGNTMLKDGTPVTKNTPPITTEEAYELARWHLEEGETYWGMYCYDVANDNVDINTTGAAVGMGSVMYNSFAKLIESPNSRNANERFARLRDDFKQYGFALPDSLVKQRFAEFPVNQTRSFGGAWLSGKSMEEVGDSLGNFLGDGRGMRWRRWLESCLLNGDIKPELLLECPVEGMSQFWAYVGKDRDNWFKDTKNGRETNRALVVEFEKWLKNPVNGKGQSIAHWKKTKDYLPENVRTQCLNGMCQIDAKPIQYKAPEVQQEIEIKTYVIGYDQMYADAIGTYKAGDFAAAATKYENMIKEYPDNALLRNDLAATYNKLGRYNDAITQAREVLHRIGDKSQYGAAQYNAGFAYEQLGDLQKALANYKLALANGNRRVQRDITRVSNMIKQGKGKTLAFKAGIKEIHQKNAKRDILLYGKEFKGNMA